LEGVCDGVKEDGANRSYMLNTVVATYAIGGWMKGAVKGPIDLTGEATSEVSGSR
jgi:hypothetical protein